MTIGSDPQAAAAAIRRMPLRRHEGDGEANPAAVSDRGWFLGVDECARFLESSCGGELRPARGFGGRWPVVSTPEWLVAPAVPLVVSRHGGDGVDAAYELRGETIWREAGGVEARLIELGDDNACPGEPFDLLWFGESERWVLRRAMLVIDDLFAEVELPATRALLEKLLVRGRRLEPAVLDGLSFDAPTGRARLAVRRPAALTSPDTSPDPEKLFLARADVERVARRGDLLELVTAHGDRAVFSCREEANGWRATLEEGNYPLTGFSLRILGDVLELSADLDARLDPLAPGLRGRLAFDLRSDLVTLG